MRSRSAFAGGATPAEVANTLGLKLNTIQKAMREGRIRAPVKKKLLWSICGWLPRAAMDVRRELEMGAPA